MRIVPEDTAGKIQFYLTHTSFWSAEPESIGLTDAEVAALSGLTAAAREAYQAQRQAQIAAGSATVTLHLALEAMAAAGSACMKKIRARAATDGNGVYSLAALPAPGHASPMPAPGMATNFEARLLPDGSLKLTWDCRNPRGAQGTMYQISRRVESFGGGAAQAAGGAGGGGGGGQGGQGGFVLLGVTGKRQFLDRTVPAGAATIIYEIVAMRSTARGEAAPFIVHLGVREGSEGLTFNTRRAA